MPITKICFLLLRDSAMSSWYCLMAIIHPVIHLSVFVLFFSYVLFSMDLASRCFFLLAA